jgi:hypothetical protein
MAGGFWALPASRRIETFDQAEPDDSIISA